MGFLELCLTAVGLSMDAFAVSVTDGLCYADLKKTHAVRIGICFGFLQGLMPTIGFLLGQMFADQMKAIDHYVALVLLSYIGGKMIYDALTEKQETSNSYLSHGIIFMQGIAVSIDALAAGISFAALSNIRIIPAALEIAITTCMISFIGVRFGKYFNRKCGKYALLTGGLILTGLGIKIFIEHVFLA